jgi:hypothetical protein
LGLGILGAAPRLWFGGTQQPIGLLVHQSRQATK